MDIDHFDNIQDHVLWLAEFIKQAEAAGIISNTTEEIPPWLMNPSKKYFFLSKCL